MQNLVFENLIQETQKILSPSSPPLSGEEITPVDLDGKPVGRSHLITRAEVDSNESEHGKHVH